LLTVRKFLLGQYYTPSLSITRHFLFSSITHAPTLAWSSSQVQSITSCHIYHIASKIPRQVSGEQAPLLYVMI
jgi:hypothetical protein